MLWAYRTMKRNAIGKTLLSLAFGIKVIIPIEIGMLSAQVLSFQEGSNNMKLSIELDVLEE